MAAAGCAHQPQRATLDDVAVSAAIESAAAQVQRCYRSPKIASVGKQIVTRLSVRYAADGSLAELPVVRWQTGITPENRHYAPKMAEAAGLAVIQCAPLRLPPETHGGWGEIDLTFSPKARA